MVVETCASRTGGGDEIRLLPHPDKQVLRQLWYPSIADYDNLRERSSFLQVRDGQRGRFEQLFRENFLPQIEDELKNQLQPRRFNPQHTEVVYEKAKGDPSPMMPPPLRSLFFRVSVAIVPDANALRCAASTTREPLMLPMREEYGALPGARMRLVVLPISTFGLWRHWHTRPCLHW